MSLRETSLGKVRAKDKRGDINRLEYKLRLICTSLDELCA